MNDQYYYYLNGRPFLPPDKFTEEAMKKDKKEAESSDDIQEYLGRKNDQ